MVYLYTGTTETFKSVPNAQQVRIILGGWLKYSFSVKIGALADNELVNKQISKRKKYRIRCIMVLNYNWTKIKSSAF